MVLVTTIDFLGKWSSNTVKGERTAAIVVDIIRVHDVGENRDAVKVIGILQKG